MTDTDLDAALGLNPFASLPWDPTQWGTRVGAWTLNVPEPAQHADFQPPPIERQMEPFGIYAEAVQPGYEIMMKRERRTGTFEVTWTPGGSVWSLYEGPDFHAAARRMMDALRGTMEPRRRLDSW